MSYSRIQIISLSLIQIGQKPINDIADIGDQGIALDLYYDLVLASCLRSNYWPFANALADLNLLSTSPLFDWKYAYQLPSDWLAVNNVSPTTNYRIYEDKIYANITPLRIDYRFLPDHSRFTPDFVDYFAMKLAKIAARFGTVDAGLMTDLKEATAEAAAAAISAATKDQPNRQIVSSRMIAVRGTGRGGIRGNGGY